MPDSNAIHVKCPKCGTTIKTTLVSSLTPDSKQLKALFEGTLNKVDCPHCKTSFVVSCPQLVFKDPDKNYILYLMPAPEDDNFEEMENQVDAMAIDVANRENLERPTVRLVFSRVDFIEKIAIHLLDLDDRLVEYAKLQLFRTIEEPQLSRSTHHLLLDFSHCDDENMHFLVYDKELQKNINVIQVPTPEFKELEQEITYNEQLLAELESAFPGCNVSADKLL